MVVRRARAQPTGRANRLRRLFTFAKTVYFGRRRVDGCDAWRRLLFIPSAAQSGDSLPHPRPLLSHLFPVCLLRVFSRLSCMAPDARTHETKLDKMLLMRRGILVFFQEFAVVRIVERRSRVGLITPALSIMLFPPDLAVSRRSASPTARFLTRRKSRRFSLGSQVCFTSSVLVQVLQVSVLGFGAIDAGLLV